MTRAQWHEILEGRDPRWGRLALGLQQFAVVTALILFSLSTRAGPQPLWLGLGHVLIVVAFAAEYLLRLWAAPDRRAYALGFWGLVDLFAFLPSLLLLPFDGRAVRALRLLQLLRLLKIARYNRAIGRLRLAFHLVRDELTVALVMSAIILYLAAVGIWLFERDAQPEKFGDVFRCLWWAVATLTTVGYGDVYPVTAGGRIFTSLILVVGLAIVAVPTGLISSALTREDLEKEASDDSR